MPAHPTDAAVPAHRHSVGCGSTRHPGIPARLEVAISALPAHRDAGGSTLRTSTRTSDHSCRVADLPAEAGLRKAGPSRGRGMPRSRLGGVATTLQSTSRESTARFYNPREGRFVCRHTGLPNLRHTGIPVQQLSSAADPVYRLTVIPAYRYHLVSCADPREPFLSGGSGCAGTPAPGMPVSRISGMPACRATPAHEKPLRQPVYRHTGHCVYRCAGIPAFRGAVLILRAHRDSG